MRRSTKRIAIVATALALSSGAGAAYAAWTVQGDGAGYSKATTAAELGTLDVSAGAVAQLYPGAEGDLMLKISNTNAFPVKITSVTGNGAITSDKAGCTGADTGVTFTDQTNLSIEVAAGGSTEVTFDDAVAMSNASVNACQGALFTIPVHLYGASDAA